jgi:AraC family transcriptional regulator, arabinose operon regulatory protein
MILSGDIMINNKSFAVVTERDRQLPFYLTTVGCEHSQEYVDRPNGYADYQWIQCIEGEGQLIVNGRKENVGAHQGMFLFPHVPHKYYSTGGEWKVHWISFNGGGMECFLKASAINSGVYFIKNEEMVWARIKKTLTVSQSNSSLKNIEASGIIYEMLMDILMYASKSSNDSTEEQYMKLEPAFEYIQNNYNKLITLEDISKTMGVTPQHLCVLFKSITGMRPFEYINSVRISKGKDLIINNSNLEIKEVARTVGYDNTSYFCSIFRKMEGVSPGKFKKLYL